MLTGQGFTPSADCWLSWACLGDRAEDGEIALRGRQPRGRCYVPIRPGALPRAAHVRAGRTLARLGSPRRLGLHGRHDTSSELLRGLQGVPVPAELLRGRDAFRNSAPPPRACAAWATPLMPRALVPATHRGHTWEGTPVMGVHPGVRARNLTGRQVPAGHCTADSTRHACPRPLCQIPASTRAWRG